MQTLNVCTELHQSRELPTLFFGIGIKKYKLMEYCNEVLEKICIKMRNVYVSIRINFFLLSVVAVVSVGIYKNEWNRVILCPVEFLSFQQSFLRLTSKAIIYPFDAARYLTPSARFSSVYKDIRILLRSFRHKLEKLVEMLRRSSSLTLLYLLYIALLEN